MNSPKSIQSNKNSNIPSTPSFKQKSKTWNQNCFSESCFFNQHKVNHKNFSAENQMKPQIFIPFQPYVNKMIQKEQQKNSSSMKFYVSGIKQDKSNKNLKYQKIANTQNIFQVKRKYKDSFQFVDNRKVKIQKRQTDSNYHFRPYRCDYKKCQKRFSKSADLHEHKQEHEINSIKENDINIHQKQISLNLNNSNLKIFCNQNLSLVIVILYRTFFVLHFVNIYINIFILSQIFIF